jgi:hypothetical protein
MKILKGILVFLLWLAGLFLCSYIADYCGGGIESGTEYGFWYGCLHGLLSVANFVRSWFVDIMCKADMYTIGYSIAYWIFTIVMAVYVFSWIFICVFKTVLPEMHKVLKAQFDEMFSNKK